MALNFNYNNTDVNKGGFLQDFLDQKDTEGGYTNFKDWYQAYTDGTLNTDTGTDTGDGTDTGTDTGDGTDTGTDTPPVTTPIGDVTQITANSPTSDGQMYVGDYSGQIAADPQLAFSNEMLLGGNTPEFSQDQVNSGEINYQDQMNYDQYTQDANQVVDTAQADAPTQQDASKYQASTSYDKIDTGSADVNAAQGSVSSNSAADVQEIDVEAHAAEVTGLGKALTDYAFLDLDNVDARATVLGQIDLLQEQFRDAEGNPTIPSWASAAARNVQKIAAFKGITGTAATEALANALMESSVQIAQQDAKFFQTVTLTNLDNQQKSLIQRASVLANMDLANLDARTAVAINNSKAFLQMDLANLSNEQQAAILSSQQRFQSIMEDTKQENVAKAFGAEADNQMAQFYESLGAQISQFNATQLNGMAQFNTDQDNSMSRFYSTLADSREKYYRDNQYNIDLANAQWRQTVATTETQMQFEAAALDVKNMVDFSQEALNKLWDRADSLLDYAWKSTENELERDLKVTLAELSSQTSLDIAKISASTQKSIANSQLEAADRAGFGQVLGTIAGSFISGLF